MTIDNNTQYLLDELETKVAELFMRIQQLESRLLANEKIKPEPMRNSYARENMNYPKSLGESFGTIDKHLGAPRPLAND